MLAFNYKLTPDDLTKFHVSLYKMARAPLSFREEIIETARFIKNSTDRPIYIALSGGIDSDVVVRAFLEANINFTAFTAIHSEGTNKHDVDLAFKLVEKFKLKHTTVELSARDFFTNGFKQYKNSGYISRNIFRYMQLFILDEITKLNGCAVLGGGDASGYCNINDEVHFKWNRDYAVPLEWMENNNQQHFPYFYMTTPEITAAWLEHPFIKLLTSNPIYYKSNRYGYIPEKALILHRDWPDLQRRTKFNGFEKMLDIRIPIEQELRSEIPESYSSISVSDMRKQLGL